LSERQELLGPVTDVGQRRRLLEEVIKELAAEKPPKTAAERLRAKKSVE